MFADLLVDSADASRIFFDRREELAFATALREATPKGREHDAGAVVRALIDREGLGYGALPKALIPFHSYPEGPRTAFAEQLVEAAGYAAAGSEGVARVHFTVTPEHRELFESLLATVGAPLEAALGVRFAVDFSIQDPSSETLCTDDDGEAFRTSGGELLLRPAGHGALLRNLQNLGGDIVVIKNIDNILPQDRQPEVVHWKRLLIGLLLRLEEEIHDLDRRLEDPSFDRREAAHALARLLGLQPPERRLGDWVVQRLRRPLRVCGMVRNSGEPGGGPFWVTDPLDLATPQVVESSQIDDSDGLQAAAWETATHFNPVDLVCSLRDRRGRPYDLAEFVDPATAFVSRMWNGAMAGWNSVFVEVPAATFAPVKTVLDLLRPEHLPPKVGATA
jgi:hypothetical protein